MPEYEHNREERIDAVIRGILSSKENAIKWMHEAGLAAASDASNDFDHASIVVESTNLLKIVFSFVKIKYIKR